jgi:E3 ubiquitin-protein ligase EDD1
MDESISHVAARLEHSTSTFQDVFQGHKITKLITCNLYTLAVTDSNAIYWWGVLPFNQRKKLWDKYRAKTKKQTRPPGTNSNSGAGSSSSSNEITVDSQVLMRVAPMYQNGSIGFTVQGGIPKVGQLLNSAWSLTDKCRFKVSVRKQFLFHRDSFTRIMKKYFLDFKVLPGPPPSEVKKTEPRSCETMPPPPSPASSTCSDTTLPSTSKRAKKNPSVKEGSEKKDEEEWNLKDVVFVEDSKNIPIGRVLKIDGSYAVINFNQAGTVAKDSTTKEEDVTAVLQNCRLLRLDDLQLVKNGVLPKSPDCIQKTPKKVHLSDLSNILSMSVDTNGIHGIVRDGKKLLFKSYNLQGKPELESVFPSDTGAFLGIDPGLISLNCSSENEFMSILRDGNGTIYPLVKDCLEAIRDPIPVDLPPFKCIGIGIHALPHVGSHQKNQVAVLVMAVEQQILMNKVLKCDIDGVRQVLANLDHEAQGKPASSVHLNKVLFERCDGNRNVFHAAVSMSLPSTNKDVDASASAPAPAAPPLPAPAPAPTGSGGTGSSTNFSSCSLDATIENLANALVAPVAGNQYIWCSYLIHCYRKNLGFVIGIVKVF